MSAKTATVAPTARKKTGQGKDAAPAAHDALGHDFQNTSSHGRMTDIPTMLPGGWRWTNLGELKAMSLYGPRFSSDDYTDNGVFVLRTTDISDSGKVATSRAPQLQLGDDDLRRYELKRGDLLITRTGSLGTLAVFNDDVKAIAGAYLIQYRLAAPLITSWYVFYALKSPAGQRHLVGRGAGVGRPNLNAPTIEAFSFPLPPEDEQRRIVAEIEKQFTRLEAGVAALRRVQANLKSYRAAVLKAACEGNLVPTEAELSRSQPSTKNPQSTFETGEQLLQGILAERRKNWTGRGKYKEPATPDIANLPPLPEGWAWAVLEGISNALGGFAFESKKFSDSGYQVVKMANIRMGRLDLSQRPSFISDITNDVAEKYQLQPRDILITLTGTRKERDYGYVVEVKHQQNLLLNQRIARLRPSEHVVSSYVQIALQSESYRNRFFAYETGNVGQGNVGMRAVTVEPIPLPPLAEQTRIVAEVERRLSVVEELESVVSANIQRATRLRQSILQKAFTGELTN